MLMPTTAERPAGRWRHGEEAQRKSAEEQAEHAQNLIAARSNLTPLGPTIESSAGPLITARKCKEVLAND
jgi:hypothetical protein